MKYNTVALKSGNCRCDPKLEQHKSAQGVAATGIAVGPRLGTITASVGHVNKQNYPHLSSAFLYYSIHGMQYYFYKN